MKQHITAKDLDQLSEKGREMIKLLLLLIPAMIAFHLGRFYIGWY